VSVQAALDEFDAPEPDADTRTCPFCDDVVNAVKLPMHLDEDCEEAPREVSY